MLQIKPLPDGWIDRIFSQFSAMYGSRFADLWKGSDPIEVKALWAEKLAGFYDQPEAIKGALDACFERPWPPNLPEFLILCRTAANASRKPVEHLALAAPNITPEVVQNRLKRINAAIGRMVGKS